jgi:protein-S-isoprenylcysteine O-methyltransferase Ste14
MKAHNLPSKARETDPIMIASVMVIALLFSDWLSLGTIGTIFLMVGGVTAAVAPLEFMGASWQGRPRPNVHLKVTAQRAAIKYLGICAGIACVLAAWFILPEYRRPYFSTLFEAIPIALPWILVATAAVVFYTEWRLGEKEDDHWQVGCLILGRSVDWSGIKSALFGWIVKGFFLPLNFSSAAWYLKGPKARAGKIFEVPWWDAVNIAEMAIFFALVIAIIPGYLFSSRLLETTNKTVEQTAFAWVVTLLCYPPINVGSWAGWFNYHPRHQPSNMPWVQWTQSVDWLAYLAGATILLMGLVHYWGEAITCLRSSHLTNRGIITNGPYRFCKHPVYVSKCIAWFIIFLPFLQGDGILGSLRLTIAFLAFCVIYALRGWVEERLLSKDPDYVTYALWIDQNGIFAWVGRLIPAARFSWRLEFWRCKSETSSEAQQKV